MLYCGNLLIAAAAQSPDQGNPERLFLEGGDYCIIYLRQSENILVNIVYQDRMEIVVSSSN